MMPVASKKGLLDAFVRDFRLRCPTIVLHASASPGDITVSCVESASVRVLI